MTVVEGLCEEMTFDLRPEARSDKLLEGGGGGERPRHREWCKQYSWG